MNDNLDRDAAGDFRAGDVAGINRFADSFLVRICAQYAIEEAKSRIDLVRREWQCVQIIERSFILKAAQISIAYHLFVSVGVWRWRFSKLKSG